MMKCSVELLEVGALLREIQSESSFFGNVLWEMAYCFYLLWLHLWSTDAFSVLTQRNILSGAFRDHEGGIWWRRLFQSSSNHIPSIKIRVFPGQDSGFLGLERSDQTKTHCPFSLSEGRRWRLAPLMSIPSYQKTAHRWLFLAVLLVVVLLEMRKGARSTLRKEESHYPTHWFVILSSHLPEIHSFLIPAIPYPFPYSSFPVWDQLRLTLVYEDQVTPRAALAKQGHSKRSAVKLWLKGRLGPHVGWVWSPRI